MQRSASAFGLFRRTRRSLTAVSPSCFCDDASLLVARLALAVLIFALQRAPINAQEMSYTQLQNGMRIGPGVASSIESISTTSAQKGGAPTGNRPIRAIDDGLRVTYVNGSKRNIQGIFRSTAPPMEQITFPSAQEVSSADVDPGIQGVIRIGDFNKYGRRTYSIQTIRGRADVLQGITLLTPNFAKLEVLQGGNEKFAWDQRLAISSIPLPQLQQILEQELDLDRASEWQRLYKFYVEAKLYREARKTITEALRRFPTELAGYQNLAARTDQLIANQKLEEIDLRLNAGQTKMAQSLLLEFPRENLPTETQIVLDDQIKELKRRLLLVSDVVEALKTYAERLPETDRNIVNPVINEIFTEINLDTAARFSEFQGLRNDNTASDEDAVSLAVGGWLLGPNAGIQNFAVAKSLIRVRSLVREYLNDATANRRQAILAELQSEEGAQPALLDKLLETMRPPQTLPEHIETDPPGLYRVSVSQYDGTKLNYLVQLPPEYDPNRKYPCVFALPEGPQRSEVEINWWCGPSIELKFGNNDPQAYRFGHATRYGYIVVSPDWMQPGQSAYQYTEGEQHRALACLRDALRKTSIDTDRIFISGHMAGATAAWDIAVSHPDMWAGLVAISPAADKYIAHYSENIAAHPRDPGNYPLGVYIVYGSFDGTRYQNKLGAVATEYLASPSYDAMVVEYRGRGRERFIAELPRIMEWMELSSHRRIRTPKQIDVRVMRPGDRFFYWAEAPQLDPRVAGNAFLFDPASSGKIEASLLDSKINGLRVSSMPSASRDCWVWLAPEMVDFSRPIQVIFRNDRSQLNVSPSVQVMLEDVRTRADRMHVFWQRLELP